jgi:phosphatidate phosphatase APP1
MIFKILTFPFRYSLSKLKKALGKLDKIKIEPLYAFGNEKEIYFKGRVTETYRQSRPSANKNYLQNVLAAFRRYAGSSVPESKVLVTFQSQDKVVESDGEGIIACSFENQTAERSDKEFMNFQLYPEEGLEPEIQKYTISVQQYPSYHPMGIISDIDDTILISHATDVGKKLWLSVSKNAYTRRPFPGVSAFYKALTDEGRNPIFYVSSSDWNLFDLIKDFLEYRNIPHGPLLLKDLHVDLRNIWKSGGGSHEHKKEKVNLLFSLYSGMKFILIGDSGQHDPEIYADVVQENPGRVMCIYIRQIKSLEEDRREELKKAIAGPEAPEMVFVKTTDEAMKHAKEKGFIF